VEAYLARLRARPRLRDHAFENVLLFAPILAHVHPPSLVELTLEELRNELPADIAARPRPRGRFYRGFSHHEWDKLAINSDGRRFFPASPLREPFAALFDAAPPEALRLVRDLTNHAITAWRQLFELDPGHMAKPLPLVLEFPWGPQTFWGDGRVYQWSRGHWGPATVSAGLMALERWAFAQAEQGREVDDVIREVVSGHGSVAVLGIALALALSAGRASRATLPLAVAQRL
jgi:hypothetical protein